jgi:hypothetical protein
MNDVGRTSTRKPIRTPKSTNAGPSQHTVRPEGMDAFEQSVARDLDLLQRLAK